MGRSAKLHKRTQKKASGTSLTATAETQKKPSAAAAVAVANAKKKANLRTKASGTKSGDGPVLGNADYVALMMGGRRKAREEARKLPRDEKEEAERGGQMEV